MQRLVQVRNEMDQETQGFPAQPIAQSAVGQHPHMLFNLCHDTRAVRTIAPGIVAAGSERNIDIVPGAGVAAPVAYLIRPVGVMHHHRLATQQARDFRAGTGGQMLIGDQGHDFMALRPPGPSRTGRQRDQKGSENAPHEMSKMQSEQILIGYLPG
jgi:hypothetical protein